MTVRVGLLQCDHVGKHLYSIGGDYQTMFRTFLPNVDFQSYDVCHHHFPISIDECDVYLMTGSKYSVYDPLDWIDRLKSFIRTINTAHKPFVGICFGHQMMAEALGGSVQKSEVGWCVGAHNFTIKKKQDWMSPYQASINLIMSCQDQVVSLPENSQIVAQSRDCPVGIFTIGQKMLGIQGHPEFPKEYSRALIEERINSIGIDKGRNAQESLKTKLDIGIIAKWVMNFISDPKNSL